ncbi:MAG: recombinase family protein [Opitutaceae bacterium]
MPRPMRKVDLPSRVPVAIYTRVSTDNQIGGRFDSCESQAAICRESIRKHESEGWYEVACYTDAAYSGGTMDRPGIRALKRQIEAGEVAVVLIFKLERVLQHRRMGTIPVVLAKAWVPAGKRHGRYFRKHPVRAVEEQPADECSGV